MKSISRRGSPEHALELLEVVENDYLELTERIAERHFYRKIGQWLIQEEYLLSLLFNSFHDPFHIPIPGFPTDPRLGRRLSLFIYRYVRKRFSARSSAQAVLIRGNLRAFYVHCEKPFCAKIPFAPNRIRSYMENELGIRSVVGNRTALWMPKVLKSNLEHDPCYFCEELILGRQPNLETDRKHIIDEFLPHLWSMYENYGIVFKQVGEVLDLDKMFELLDLAGVHWTDGCGDRNFFRNKIRELISSGQSMPVSIGHGDQGLKNMILRSEDDRFVLIDWESAAEMPIIFDVWSLSFALPDVLGFMGAKIAKAASISGVSNLMSIPAQMALASLRKASTYAEVGVKYPAIHNKNKFYARIAETCKTLSEDHGSGSISSCGGRFLP